MELSQEFERLENWLTVVRLWRYLWYWHYEVKSSMMMCLM